MTTKTGISSAKQASAVIAGLARTDRDEVGAAIVQILSELEASALAPRTLMEIAEVLRAPGADAIAGYRSGYTDRALPLGGAEARRFGHAIALLHAFETLYQRAFETALAVRPDDPARQDLAYPLQRCMACLVSQMIEHYRARQSVGPSLWKRLQERMQVANQEKLEAVVVPDPFNPRGALTPLATYGCALLLSIAQVGAMTHRNLEATLALTALFAYLVDSAMLDKNEDAGITHSQGGIAGVGIKRAGRIRIVVAGGVTHLVNTTKIDEALNWCVQRLAGGDPPEQIGLATVAKADLAGLLPRLRRIWCGAGEIRESERQPLEEQSAVVIGFREIFEFASPGPPVIPREFDVYNSSPEVSYGKSASLPGFDQQANPVESWQTLDLSASGMRAKRPKAGTRLRRGQLLAIGFKGMEKDFGFALAEVRWLQQFTDSEAGGVAAGVRFVSSHAEVALVRVFGLVPDEYQTIGPAFVLDQSTPHRLVLPPGWFTPGRKLDLWYKERVSPIELTDLQASGADHEIVGYKSV
jgi:cyclic-di-GMP-binding protein